MPLKVHCRFCGEIQQYLEVFSNSLKYREKNLGKKGLCIKCNMPLFKLRHKDGSEYTKDEYIHLIKSGFIFKNHTKKIKRF